MSAITPTDELLNRCFRLAYFILGDKMASMYLTAAALDRLSLASAAQGRRRQYVPQGRSAKPAARTKVSLGRLHLLQRLIFKEAEAFERLQEAQASPPGQHDMVIRYVKHLVMSTSRRNSFYVSLGLCRILHNYATAETAEIYSLVIQDPDRGRDDHYFRSRKMHLVRELKERFGDSLQLRRLHRGEERFEPQADPGNYLPLVRECLSRFTPWDSSCVLPAGIDPTGEVAASLQFRDGEPDGEHEVEINRIHTLLHPDCLGRLTAALELDPPSRRLEVPRFFNAGDDRGLTDERFEPRPLSAEELNALRLHLKASEARRVEATRKFLTVLADGVERTRFEVSGAGRVPVKIAAGSEWLEVRSLEDGEAVPIALHPVPYHEGGFVPRPPSFTRGAGHTLSFEAHPPDALPGAPDDTTVIVGYRETGAGVLISAPARRLGALLRGGLDAARLGVASRPRLALASLVIAVGVGGLLLYLFSRTAPPTTPPGRREQIVRRGGTGDTAPPVQPSPETQDGPRAPLSTQVPMTPPAGRAERAPAPRPSPGGARLSPAPPDETGEDEATRAEETLPAAKGLLSVRRVYVDPLGGGVAAGVREALVARLSATGRFEVVGEREGSDAVLEGSVTRANGGDNISARLHLVNAEGKVIWPAARGRRWATYAGRRAGVTARIVADLLGEIRRLEGQR